MARVRSARVFQAVGLVAWALGVVAITGLGSNAFLAPAGALLAVLGVAVLGDWRGVRAGLYQVQRRYPNRYPPPERVTYWRVYGTAIVLVGTVWAAAGIISAAT
jgi:hypothetical protein